MRTRTFLLAPEPTDADLDPYTIDETTITLDDWRHQEPAGEDAVVVRLHQPHYANLVA